MKKKHLIITAVLLLLIAGGITTYFLLNRGAHEAEEEDFLPDGWQVGADELEDTTLTFYVNAQRQNTSDEIQEAVNLKLEKDLKTKISFKFLWYYYDTFLDRIKRDNASGITCDAFFYSPDFYVPVKSLADEGLIKDVSELFPQYAPGYYSQFTNEDIKALNVNGGIYIIPSRMPSSNIKYALVRQDLMEKYDVPEIHSFDDYEIYLDTIIENEPDMVPMRYWDSSLGLFTDMYGYVILDYISGLVYKWDDPSMKIMAWEQTPEYIQCLERLQRWVERGYLDPESDNHGFSVINGRPNTTISTPFITDPKSASFIGNPADEIYFNKLLRSKGITDFSYKAYPLYDEYSARNSIMDNGIMINVVSKQAERVLKFIDWLQSDQENYDLLMYGKKSVHYIDRGDYIEPPADAITTFLEWSWKPPFENIDYQRATYPGHSDELKEYREIMTEQTKYPPHYGFSPDFSAVNKMYEERWMRFTIPENIVLNGGDPNDEKMQKFMEDQKASETDSLIAEIQGQLDEYKARPR
jgi:putative aldouronate transport system substrate-binding protein